MMRRAPARGLGAWSFQIWGWSMFAAAAVAAAFCPLPVQLAFAVVAIGVVGMAHGASDLAIVSVPRRPMFLGWYAAVASVCLAWWLTEPAIALPAFLLASAIHFGLEDAPAGAGIERIARGVSLVATPAVLHAARLGEILRLGGVAPAFVPVMVGAMAILGAGAAAVLMMMAVGRGDRRLLGGTAAVLVLPPLTGFSVAFLVLHALPQTEARRRQLGCVDHVAYLRATWPILLAAMVLAGAIGALVWRIDPSGVRSLFTAIAALAMPHLLVTPWFEAQAGARRHVDTPTRQQQRGGWPLPTP